MEWTAIGETDSTLTETYSFNGHVESFDMILSDDYSEPVPAPNSESLFQIFYPCSSLENLPDGDKLVELVNRADFWEFLEDELIRQGIIVESRRITWGDIGAGAGVIGPLKCLAGGFANPVCIPAIGLAFAVSSAHLLCHIPWITCDGI